jgi:hypothetical protein
MIANEPRYRVGPRPPDPLAFTLGNTRQRIPVTVRPFGPWHVVFSQGQIMREHPGLDHIGRGCPADIETVWMSP